MDATTYELRTILGNERRFLVPTFQRDYEWNEKQQWSLLFDDLIMTAGRLAAARKQARLAGDSPARAEKRVSPHFLGAVVLEQLPSKAGEIDQRAVIDGQQRLTTIQLLLRALADVLAETGSSRVGQLRRLLFNPVDDPNNDPDWRYKLWPRRKDREFWRAAMNDNPAEAPGHHPYGKARQYFVSRVRLIVREVEGDSSETAKSPDKEVDPVIESASSVEQVDLETLVDAAIGLFKIVSIDLDENDDPQLIFEVLNGRQTPLSAADLVKNLLFLRAEVAHESELEELHEKYWAPIETDWWRTDVGRGHAARPRRELLLAAWLSAQTTEEANVRHLYGEIRRYLSDREIPVREVLTQIGAYRDAYRCIAEPDDVRDGARTAAAYRRLNRLGITTAYPLLLWLRTRPVQQLSQADHELAVVAVETWVIRRMLAKRNTRGYGKKFLNVLTSAKEELSSVEILRAIFMELALPNDWPSDAEVLAALEQSSFSGYHSQERVRMVLGAIDLTLAKARPKSEKTLVDYDKLQVEHLLPQKWGQHWPLPQVDREALKTAGEERSRRLNHIGNLTLLTEALNPALSNGPWSAKRPEIARHSKLQLNSEFHEPVDWNESAIAERGRRLAQVAIAIWPWGKVLFDSRSQV